MKKKEFERKYVCEICGREFIDVAFLENHLNDCAVLEEFYQVMHRGNA